MRYAGVLILGLWMMLGSVVPGCKRAASTPVGAGGGLRIVAASPAVGVIVRDLGLADRCIGRHGFDMVLPKSVPVVATTRSRWHEPHVKARVQ